MEREEPKEHSTEDATEWGSQVPECVDLYTDDHYNRTSIERKRLNCLYVMTMDNLNSAKTAMLSHHSTKSQKCVHLEMYDITCTITSSVCFLLSLHEILFLGQ